MKRILVMGLSLLLTASLLASCGGQTELQDGYYTAADVDHQHALLFI